MPLLQVGAGKIALLLGLSLFFGFAFEGFYSETMPRRPGGVRTFPLLALAGGALFLIEPHYGAAFIAGLLVIGLWIFAYLRQGTPDNESSPEGHFVVPTCNVLAYILGPIALTQPLWLSVSVAVAAVLLISGRRTLHDWAHRVSGQEVVTAAQFLILVGVVLPLLAGRPPIPYTTVTPFGVWLAVVAVSSISYASYLLQRYVFPGRTVLLTSVLGGLYSSTATTVVLSQRARDDGMSAELQSGIIAASATMYVRLLIICSIFNASLGGLLVVPLLALALLTALIAAWRARVGTHSETTTEPSNPLQIWTALIFAGLFVLVSMLTSFAQSRLGHAGVFALAGIVGVTDIDPFVLSLAQGGAASIGLTTAATAILIASSSNNVLKAVYCLAFSRRRESWIPATALAVVAVIGVALAFLKPL